MARGGVDAQRFLGDGALLVLLLELQGGDVVQAVGELDQDDPDVVGHGQDHLADVLGLSLLLGLEVHLADLGHALDDGADLGAELLGNLSDGGVRVLHGVMQQAGHDGCGVQAQVHQDVADLKRVGKVWLAREPDLPGMGRCGKNIGFLDERHIRWGKVRGRLVQNVGDTNHVLSFRAGEMESLPA